MIFINLHLLFAVSLATGRLYLLQVDSKIFLGIFDTVQTGSDNTGFSLPSKSARDPLSIKSIIGGNDEKAQRVRNLLSLALRLRQNAGFGPMG